MAELNEVMLRNLSDDELFHYYGDSDNPVIAKLSKRVNFYQQEAADADGLQDELDEARANHANFLIEINERLLNLYEEIDKAEKSRESLGVMLDSIISDIEAAQDAAEHKEAA